MKTFICGNSKCQKTFERQPTQQRSPCPNCKGSLIWPYEGFTCTRCVVRFESAVTIQSPRPKCPKCNSPKQVRLLTENELQPYQGLPAEILELIFSMLDEKGLGLLSLVCRTFREVANPLLTRFTPPMRAFGSTGHNFKRVLIGPQTGILHGASKTIQIAVDQFTYPGKNFRGSVLQYLVQKGIDIEVTLGKPDQLTIEALQRAKKRVDVATAFHKMHNKIWVIDREGVIVGSPNISYSGMEQGNFESFIHIRSPRLGAIFAKYLRLLALPNPTKDKGWLEVQNALSTYNNERHGVRLAMAPIVKITDFLVHELAGSTKIIVRQFMISDQMPRRGEPDILQVLCDMASKHVDVEIYLDEEQYKTNAPLQRAVKVLLQANAKVFTQKPVVVLDVGAERIQHDKLILAEVRSGKLVTPLHKTLIGTAGLTKHVIANANAETFVATDLDSIYETLMKHHLKSLAETVSTTRQITLS